MIYLIFIFFLAGIILQKILKNTQRLKHYLNTYLINFGLPLFLITSLVNAKIGFGSFALISILIMLITSVLFYLYIKRLKINNKKKAAIYLCSTFGNTAYLGIPISFAFFGEVGAAFAAVFTIFVSLFHYSLGIFLSNAFCKKRETAFKELLKFPVLYAVIIALYLAKINTVIPSLISSFAITAVYIAPIIIGLSFKYKGIEKEYYTAGMLKFIALPLISIAFFYYTDLSVTAKYVLLLLAAVPPALINTPLTIKYKFDDNFAASFTSISTLIFLVIITIIYFII